MEKHTDKSGRMDNIVIEVDGDKLFGIEPVISRLDAVQGSSEARTELYPPVPQGSTAADDEVMRQEFGQSSELGSEAGQNGGGDW